jgi:hypothetical protein
MAFHEAEQPDLDGDFADSDILTDEDCAEVDLAATNLQAVIAPEDTGTKARSLSRPMIDEIGSAKSQSRPVIIYRNQPNGVEAGCSKNIPTRVAIEVAAEPLGCTFRISEPKNCVSGRLRNHSRSHFVQLRLLFDKDKHKGRVLDR